MKTIKILFVLFLLFVSGITFGQRVLTEEERQQLLTSSEFQEKCQWAVRDYAAFWSVNDGSSANTEALRIKWAKDRILSINIMKTDANDPLLVVRFLNAAKGKQFTIGAAPQSTSVLIAAWVSANSFEEFVGAYFTVLGDDINFSIGN
jgi:hypothetical protein